VGQRGPGPRADGLDGFARVEPVERGTGKGFSVLAVHGGLSGWWRCFCVSFPRSRGKVPEADEGRRRRAPALIRPFGAPSPAKREKEQNDSAPSPVKREKETHGNSAAALI